MAGEEEDDVALLVLDGHDVQQAPEGARVLPVGTIKHLIKCSSLCIRESKDKQQIS